MYYYVMISPPDDMTDFEQTSRSDGRTLNKQSSITNIRAPLGNCVVMQVAFYSSLQQLLEWPNTVSFRNNNSVYVVHFYITRNKRPCFFSQNPPEKSKKKKKTLAIGRKVQSITGSTVWTLAPGTFGKWFIRLVLTFNRLGLLWPVLWFFTNRYSYLSC